MKSLPNAGIFLSIAVAVSGVLTSCGGSPQPAATPAPAPTVGERVAATPAPQRVRMPGETCVGGEPASTVMPDGRPFALQARALATVKFEVDPSGRVGRVAVVSTTNEAWGRAVSEAVRQWRYAPTICDGLPVAAEQELTLPSR